jgi:hypothetical protein
MRTIQSLPPVNARLSVEHGYEAVDDTMTYWPSLEKAKHVSPFPWDEVVISFDIAGTSVLIRVKTRIITRCHATVILHSHELTRWLKISLDDDLDLHETKCCGIHHILDYGVVPEPSDEGNVPHRKDCSQDDHVDQS